MERSRLCGRASGTLTQYGYLGVNMFFIISGFVILMTAWGRTVEAFTISRVTRLFPAYAVSVALTAVLLIVVWPQGKHIEVRHAFTNLTMLQQGYRVPHVDGAYWTLWTELRFYLLIGVFVLIGIDRRRADGGLCPCGRSLARWPPRRSRIWSPTLLVHDYAPYFAAGMMLAWIQRHRHSWLSWGLVARGTGAWLCRWRWQTSHPGTTSPTGRRRYL